MLFSCGVCGVLVLWSRGNGRGPLLIFVPWRMAALGGARAPLGVLGEGGAADASLSLRSKASCCALGLPLDLIGEYLEGEFIAPLSPVFLAGVTVAWRVDSVLAEARSFVCAAILAWMPEPITADSDCCAVLGC